MVEKNESDIKTQIESKQKKGSEIGIRKKHNLTRHSKKGQCLLRLEAS